MFVLFSRRDARMTRCWYSVTLLFALLMSSAALAAEPDVLSSEMATHGAAHAIKTTAQDGLEIMPALSFNEALRRAVERAPAIAARRALTLAAEADARRAAALPDPKLSLGIQDLPVTGAQAFDPGVDSFTMKKIGVMQEFPARAKRDARQALADRTTDQATAMTAAEELAVKRSTAEAWVSVWATEHEVDALQTLREQSTLAIRIAKARLSGGDGSAVDVLAAQAAVLDLDNRLETARAQAESARAMLGGWLGEHAEVAADSLPDFSQLPASEAVLLRSLDRQGPLLPWQAREQVAQAQVDLARADKHPDWSVGVSYGQRDRFSDLLSVEFSIDLPLFPGNRQDRGIAARQAEYEATLDEHEDARRARRVQLQTDLAQWAAFKRQVARDDQSLLPLVHDRSRIALAAYRGGGELQPWLDARRDEIETQITHAQMSGELGRAWSALAFLLPPEPTP